MRESSTSSVEARTRPVEAFARHGDRREPLAVCVLEWAILDYLACPTIHLSPAAAAHLQGDTGGHPSGDASGG